MVVDSSVVAVSCTSDFVPALRKDFLNIQATKECKFALKCVRGLIRRYSQMYGTVI